MKTICITIVVVAVLALLILLAYVWLKLRGWNITFDASMKTDAEEPIKRLPARDAKCRFTKRQ